MTPTPPPAPRLPRFPLALDRVHGSTRVAPAGELLRPQAPLKHAADAAAQLAAGRHQPSGLGLDSAAVRQRMVQRLRADGILVEAVLQAFGAVERHRFVDSALATQAYEDTSLPIGLSQTISKPSVVARMLTLLFEGNTAQAQGHLGRVLEIGTGCGYQAALLALLGRSVVSIERLKALHDKARENLAGQRQGDLRLVYGDGRLEYYTINEVQKYQALSPTSSYSDFINLDNSNDRLSASDLFNRVYGSGGRLVLQTCIAGNGDPSWGRMFIVATPATRQVLSVVEQTSRLLEFASFGLVAY